MRNVNKTKEAFIAACSVMLLLAAPAHAADASAWRADVHSAFRLIAGSNKPDARSLRAGVQIRMQPGWHTYWRYPGDSGVPPRFDFSHSQNLAAAKVLYPAPHLYTDETGNTLGYKNAVIFPLIVTPKQADKPIKLSLKLEYAICDKVCVPVRGDTELTLDHGVSTQEETIAAAEARVPQRVAAGQIDLTMKRVNDAAKPHVMVDLKAPPGAPVHVFVEGPTPEWALPIPKPMPGAPKGHRQFAFALDGLPPGVDPKGHFLLSFTVVEGAKAYEIKSRLD